MKIVSSDELTVIFEKIKQRHIKRGKSIKQAEHYANLCIDNNYILDSDDDAILKYEKRQEMERQIIEDLKRWD